LLANPIYIGEIRHKGVRYPGQHEAIVDRDTWEEVQRRLCDQAVREGSPKIKAAVSILAGKLFDEKGEPLYATAAKGRHGGRYRYYVSRELIRQGASSVAKEKAWRLAAPELERSVLVSVQRILNDQAAIATRLQEAEIPPAEMQLVLKAAEARAATLESLPQEAFTMAELVERVALRKDGIAISINLQSLLPAGSTVGQTPSLTFTEFVPLRIKRRGVAMRLVIGGGVSNGTADPTLLKAVARGRKWFNELASGRARFTQEIAARERVNGRFVRRLIPLAFLSPAIVQAIAEGRHPGNLTGEALSRGISIPVEWAKQPAALGFE
jgi:site-specific DNA recombinase